MPNSKTKKRLSVVIVGPGRMGQALAYALRSAGYSINAFIAPDDVKAKKTLRSFNKSGRSAAVIGFTELAELPPSQLVLITTPDDAIASAAERLAALRTGKPRGRTVLHTSGALASDVLGPLADIGFHTGSIHPLVSISDSLSGAKALRGAYFCLEGDGPALRVARLVVADLAGKSFSIRPEKKALYHAAAVMASPHVTALFDLATQTLAACGVSKKAAREVFLPLIDSTVKNLLAMDAGEALTGTFARGDIATVRRHLAALSGKDLEEAREIYKLLGLYSLQLAKKAGLDPELVERMRETVKSEQ